jgi:MTH538 TIR-like domain (DUF1863)
MKLEDRTPKYWAFISYSHHDKRVARRLYNEISKHAVPREFRHQAGGGSPKFNQLYLYEVESGARSELSSELREALDASRKLIIICSPFAVASGYVAGEIRYFQSLGRSADILCLVASGVPNSADEGHPEFECFPSPLRETTNSDGSVSRIAPAERPLAAAIGQETPAEWRDAVEQLLAGLLGISRGDLKRLRRKTHKGWLVALATSAAVFAGVAWLICWAYIVPHSSYAKGFVRRVGVWQPVDSITASEAAKRLRSLRFVTRGARGRLTSVFAVDGRGQCAHEGLKSITDDDFTSDCSAVRACRVDFEYSPQGDLVREIMRDQRGNSLETLTYDLPALAILSEAVVGCSRVHNGIKFVEFERFDKSSGSSSGFDHLVRFRSNDKTHPEPNREYAFGTRYEYDSAGRVKERWALDEQDKPKATAAGPAGTIYTYGPAGELQQLANVNAAGLPAIDDGGHASISYQYDAHGNLIAESYFGTRNEPVYDKSGVHAVEYTYGPRGELLALRFLDTAGKPTLNDQGYALERDGVDARGFTVERRFFDVQGVPTRDVKHQCFVLRMKFNALGDWTSEECFDASGLPALGVNGVHELRRELGSRGDDEQQSYWGIHGEPVNCARPIDGNGGGDGCPIHLMVNAFDEAGDRVSARFYNTDGSPAVDGSTGAAGWDAQYDGAGYETREIEIGIDGKAAIVAAGSFGVESQPDEFGRESSTTFLGADLRPTPMKDGIESRRLTYDDGLRQTRVEFLGANGEPVRNSQAVVGWVNTRDVFGNGIMTSDFGPDSKPARSSDGNYGLRMVFDRYQRSIATTSIDANGSPMVDDSGNATVASERDPRGRAIHTRFLDSKGKPVANQQGVAGYDSDYDDLGREIMQKYVGTDGNPSPTTDGVCVVAYGRDDRGRVVEQSYHDCNAHLVGESRSSHVAVIRQRWDERDRLVERRFFDALGRPALNGDGAAGYLSRYDARDRLIESDVLGLDGRPGVNSSGLARSMYEYNSLGEELKAVDYSDKDAALRTATYAYDADGNETRRLFLGPDGTPVLNQISGRAEARFKYDPSNRLLQEASFGVHGEPVNRRDAGWFRRVLEYDGSGLLLSQHCFKVSGAAVSPCRNQ